MGIRRRKSELIVTGRVFRDQDMLVCECDTLKQTTWAHSLEDIFADCSRLIVEYLSQAKDGHGELKRFGVRPTRAGKILVKVTLDLSAIMPPVDTGFDRPPIESQKHTFELQMAA